MRRVLLLVTALAIVVAIAMPAAAVYYLAYTESGFRFMIGRVPHTIAGVQLDIVGPSGNLADGIRVERLEIDHHLVHLKLEGIQGRVELLPLLLQTIRTRNASIHSVLVQAKHRTRPPTPSTPFFLPRWLIVNAQQAHVDSVTIIAPDGGRLDATEIHASGIARYRKIRLFEAGAQFGSLRVDGAGELLAYDPLRLDVTARMSWLPDDQPSWSVETASKGDLNELAVTGHTLTPFRSDFTGQALDLTNRWHWVASANVHDFDVTRWGGTNVLGLLSGQLTGTGDRNGFTARGPVDSSGLKVGLFDAEFEGSYSDHVVTARRIDLTHRTSGAHVAGGGTIAVVTGGPQLDLYGSWRDFRWPLVGKSVPFRSASGDFTLQGRWPYSIHASGIAAAQDLPPMPVRVDGSLAKDRFTFASAGVDLYDGHAELSGAVTWAPAETWSVSGHFSDVNPGRLREDLPGQLSFNLASAGQRFDAKGDFYVDIRDLSGRMRGVSAGGGGKLTRTGGAWQFEKVRLALGGTDLALDGHINESFDLRFSLASRDLSLLESGSQGRLEGSGTLRGTWQQPVINATARGRDIRHQGIAIEALDAHIDFDPSVQYASNVEARVRNLVYRQRKLDELTLSLDGKPTNYVLGMDAKALGLASSLRANGPYVNGAWHGQLTAMSITGTESLHLELERPVEWVASVEAIRAPSTCLAGRPASVCVEGEWTPAQWNATFKANELPLATLTAGMTQAVEYGGRINIHGRLQGGAQARTEGSVRADLTDAQLTHRLASGRRDVTKIGSGVVAVSATRNALDAEVGLEEGDVGTIKGSLQAQRVADDWQALPVHGELHAHTDQLGLITLYVPDIDRAAGHLDADMSIAGTLGTPLIKGNLDIANGEIDSYAVNLGMRQVAFDAVLSENGLDFKGYTRIGSGTADARGRLEWRNSLPYGTVHVEGSNLRVMDVPEAQIDASPALDFKINGRRIEATGAVKVPYAKIVPADLTGAVRSSSDEIVVGQEQTDPAKRFEVVSTITLTLADKVSIDTSGLTGRLTGNITVRSGYDSVTSATGELSIEQGKYTAYARKLDIQRGRLIFSGGPIGNPGIDIRAIKEFPDVTAGVNVRGTLLQPRMSFFSDPSLTQSQIVSLILSGGSLESAQNRQAGAGYEALAQGGAILAQQLGSRVGIQDVSLESDLTNQTSLVLGRYLSPRLYVSYGVALTEQLNVLKLRYSLGDRWTIKTEVGQARGADLVYTIQR